MQFVTSENKDAFFTQNELRDLRKYKVQNKISDIDYLSAHPEIEAIIIDLYKQVLDKTPDKDAVYCFVATYFKQLNEERSRAMG